MTNQWKRGLALLLSVVMLMGVVVMTGVFSAAAEDTGAGVPAAAAVRETARYATGDMNNDTDINASDALLALQVSVKLVTPDKAANEAGDVSSDGTINATDALMILQYSVKLISGFEADKADPDTPDEVSLGEELADYTGKEYYFDNFKTAKKVYAISNLNVPDERFCALGLQGIVNGQGESQIAVVYDFDSYNQWLWELENTYGIEVVKVANLDELINTFKSYIKDGHYVKYPYFDENKPEGYYSMDELSACANACTIAGQERWLMIDSKLETRAKNDWGLTLSDKTITDLYGEQVLLGEADKFDEYLLQDYYYDSLNKDMIVILGARDYNMRDLGIANGALFFSNNVTRKFPTEHLNPNALIFGWVDSEGTSERISFDSDLVNNLTNAGFAIVPSDHANNITVWSGLDKSNFKQTPALSNARTDTTAVHYATLIMEGGSNYSLVERGFVQTQAHLPFVYWNNENRGTIPMGWTMNPIMTDMAPNILGYLTRTATVNDQFVGSLSGLGYNYSNMLGFDLDDVFDKTKSASLRSEHYKRTAEYMQGAGMEYITAMENAPIDNEEDRATQLSYYSEPAGIKGGFLYYHNGSGYVAPAASDAGALFWSNNKPFVALRDALHYSVQTTLTAFRKNGNKPDVKSQSERNQLLREMAWRLNNRAKDATKIDGYSAINVYHYGFSYEDCITLSKMLDEDVVLVTPGEFLQLIQKNVAKQNARVTTEPHMGEDAELPVLPGAGLAEMDQALALTASKETDFDFSTGNQGWCLVAGDGVKDAAWFSENTKAKTLQINLAGTKVDDETNDVANALTYNKIAFGAAAKTFNVYTGSASSADIKLIAVDAEGNQTVITNTRTVKDEEGEETEETIEWVRIPSGTNITTTWDISSLAGKEVALYVEFKGASVRITGFDIQ